MFGPDVYSALLGITQRIFGTQDNVDVYTGLKLSYAVSNNQSFCLDGTLNVQSADGRSSVLRGVQQSVPRFIPHTDTDAVLDSWRATILGDHLTRFGYDRSDLKQWSVDTKVVPDIRDKETVLTLAKLAANAYVPTPHKGDWSEVNGTENGNWTHEGPGYGWDDDGLRGYVFTTEDEELMVLSIKGTSTAVWNDGGPTAPNDKENDNAFFSCCCGRVSRMWTPVCDCYLGDHTCDEQCLDRELLREDRYYSQILDVYANALKLVPKAKVVWITGHSLGGALSSMLGRTYALPVVTFEAPGDQLAVKRLHLPVPPGIPPWEEYVWHFGHNSDPIYLGTCQGSRSTCALKGYAMETKCHSGMVCTYDTKKDFGWYESVANHRIHVVIDDVLEKYNDVAICAPPEPCEDCSKWTFVDPFYDPEPLPDYPVSSSTTHTHPPSTKLKTTESVSSTLTTTPTTTSSITRSASVCQTSTCLSHNWYGQCADWSTYTTSVPQETDCIERNWRYSCVEYTTYPASACPT